jgi:hypothetical protein
VPDGRSPGPQGRSTGELRPSEWPPGPGTWSRSRRVPGPGGVDSVGRRDARRLAPKGGPGGGDGERDEALVGERREVVNSSSVLAAGVVHPS